MSATGKTTKKFGIYVFSDGKPQQYLYPCDNYVKENERVITTRAGRIVVFEVHRIEKNLRRTIVPGFYRGELNDDTKNRKVKLNHIGYDESKKAGIKEDLAKRGYDTDIWFWNENAISAT